MAAQIQMPAPVPVPVLVQMKLAVRTRMLSQMTMGQIRMLMMTLISLKKDESGMPKRQPPPPKKLKRPGVLQS